MASVARQPPNCRTLDNAIVTPHKKLSFACEPCRAAKRKCDGVKPACSLCQRQARNCVYNTDPRPRKRKYWDEEYVHSLEDQVQTLLSLLAKDKNPARSVVLAMEQASTILNNPEFDPPVYEEAWEFDNQFVLDDVSGAPSNRTADERSQAAIEELSVMMWRTNLGDGVAILADPSGNSGSDQKVSTGSVRNMAPQIHHETIEENSFLGFAQDRELTNYLAALFLENINPFHQFVTYQSTDFLNGFPHQEPEFTFIHCALLATGASFSDRPNAAVIGDVFAERADSLAFQTCKNSPTLAVVQGLCMLTWRSLALGRDSMGWMYISMAAGMAVHLRLHVLALQEVSPASLRRSPLEIRTFWVFYIIDRTAISILGRNCALPWRRINVPTFEDSFYQTLGSLEEVSFGAQCQLWYLHDKFMDQVYASNFETLPVDEKSKLLVESQDALASFYKSHDKRLYLSDTKPSKPILLFHMAYQMSILLIHPPFLQVSDRVTLTAADRNISRIALRSITIAASAMTRLIRTYVNAFSFRKANPVLIHHLLSAAVVHLMNATSSRGSLRGQSTKLLRLCMDLLLQLRKPWPNRADKSIRVIQLLAHRWKVVSALPIEHSYPLASESAKRDAGMLSVGEADSRDVVETSGTSLSDILPFDSALFDNVGYLGVDYNYIPAGYDTFLGSMEAFGCVAETESLGWTAEDWN